MSKNQLLQPDLLLDFLHKVQEQHKELLKSMGDFETKKAILIQELKDLDIQIETLNCYQDCIDDLEVHILNERRLTRSC